MLGRVSASIARQCRASVPLQRSLAPRAAGVSCVSAQQLHHAAPQVRSFASPAVQESLMASDAWKKSCYVEIDYTIDENMTVYDCVQRFSAFDIGCLVTIDEKGEISGVISERDYVNKIALLGRDSKGTLIKEISTKSANLVTATPKDSVDVCMSKMLTKDIRHLPLLDDDGKVVGMLSIKDLVKSAMAEREKTIKTLSDFALGKGGHFGSE
uniref:CBS domain-containing protein n=1 Tax=Odontella aurita TaxID=265563 RepID=A0A7S4MVG7_9STRA|mmetsp:Transcript_33563/g.100037  ORF Transcript_33563/g.100037 Transcript_33563/m.100037 type:complete len:212 (+) Transcript_33563:55-690(+)